MPPQVTVLTTGGTIASTAGNEGAEPEKRGEELLDSVPAIENYADLTVTQVVQRPSFDMDTETMAMLAREARTAVSEGSDGVVITHGTDTMEESAYYLDLVLDLDAPIAFTGAQRRPDEVSPDGPANLLASIRVVTDAKFQDQGGVYIVLDDEAHAARNVTKMHTAALDTFQSPDTGPVGVVTRETVRTYREPGSRSIDLSVMESEKWVPMVKSAAGIDGTAFERLVKSGADGIVIEGTGLGNTTAALGEKIKSAIQGGTPVVVTSRSPGGSTLPVYGTGGGGKTLADNGVIFGDDLPAHKARLKLQLGLATTDDMAELRGLFGE